MKYHSLENGPGFLVVFPFSPTRFLGVETQARTRRLADRSQAPALSGFNLAMLEYRDGVLPMTQKPLNDIDEADIQALIDNSISENKTMEYKENVSLEKDWDNYWLSF